jgi:ABC-type multidrug transport system ATPase subunit
LTVSHVVASNLAYAHPGGDLLFAGVSFKIKLAQHVGLVGANGVGKSTIFRVLAGELAADEGDVDIGPFAGRRPGGRRPLGARAAFGRRARALARRGPTDDHGRA